jgi:hypothetical protein
MMQTGSNHIATDAAEAVNAYFDGHSPPMFCFPVYSAPLFGGTI